ncbi:hypothetical protein ACFL5V_01445 [Fibrobacterota bacterium]
MKRKIKPSIIIITAFLLSMMSCDDNGTDPGTTCQPKAEPVSTEEHVVLLSPRGCQVYALGDTVPVSWEYRNRPTDRLAYFSVAEISLDNALNFDIELFGGAISHAESRIDTFWIIPMDPLMVSDSAVIRLRHYRGIETIDNGGLISITQ